MFGVEIPTSSTLVSSFSKLDEPGESVNVWWSRLVFVARYIFVRHIKATNLSREPKTPYDTELTILSVTFKPVAFIPHEPRLWC